MDKKVLEDNAKALECNITCYGRNHSYFSELIKFLIGKARTDDYILNKAIEKADSIMQEAIKTSEQSIKTTNPTWQTLMGSISGLANELSEEATRSGESATKGKTDPSQIYTQT